MMRWLKKLKQIQRELNVIRKVVTAQGDVLKQLVDDLTKGEFAKDFEQDDTLKQKRDRRAAKLQQRLERLLALEKRAEAIRSDVSPRGLMLQPFGIPRRD